MQERPEPEAYEAMPDNGEAYLKEILAQVRQMQTNTKRIVDGGAWALVIALLFATATLGAVLDVF